MAGLLIPNDWDVEIDGYCTLTLTIPNSAMWRAVIFGALHGLTRPFAYDPDTGNVESAVTIAKAIDNSRQDVCP